MVTAPLLRLISAALEPRLHPHRPHFDLPAPEVLTAVLSMASSKPTATVVLYILQYCMMYATPAHAAVEGRASVIALHWLRQPPADVLSEPGLVDLWIASVDYLQQYITQRVTTDNATRFEVLKRLGLYPVVLRTCDVAFQLLSCPAEEDPEIGLLAAAIELCGGIGHAARHSPIEAERSLVPFFVRLMEMCFEPASICAEIDYETAEEAVTAFRMILAHPEERRRALSARGGRFVLDLIEWTGNDLKDGEMVTCGLPPLLTCLIQDQQQVPRRMPLLLVGMLADGKNQLARLRLEALDALGGLLCRTGIELPAAVSQRLPKAVPGLLQCIQEAVDQAASQRERQPEGISIRASTGTQGLQKLMEVFPECFEAAVKAGVIQMLTRMAALDVLVSTQAVDVLTWAVGLQPSLGEPLTSPDGLRCILSAVRHAVMAALSAFHTPELVAALLGVLRRVVPRAWEDVSDARLLACYMAMGLLCRCTHHLTPANRQMLLGMLVELVTRHNKLPPAQQCCQRGIQLFEDTLGVFVNITAEEDALSREQKDTLVQTVCSLLGALGATTAQRSITKEARTMVEAAVYICCQLHRLQDIERHAQQSKGLCETLRAVSRNILLVRRKQQQAEKAAGGADTEAATAAAEAAMQALLAEEQMAKAQQAAKAAKRQRQKAKAKQKQAAADVQAPSQRPLSAAEEAQRAELQDTLCCPITQVLFQDPVVAADGYTYERSAITDWLRCRNTSPMTNTVLPDRKLTPNRQAKALIASLSPNVRAALA
ncbi:hypothetical protein WJX72_008202 [[Myrmecia] bisecta]|uniref:RING-type E3 ubiquitin transferase n=1 Tax=[Myrmecia] bisecta TaxID=41462 RepID=A0AAW1P8D8_9CHLO